MAVSLEKHTQLNGIVRDIELDAGEYTALIVLNSGLEIWSATSQISPIRLENARCEMSIASYSCHLIHTRI